MLNQCVKVFSNIADYQIGVDGRIVVDVVRQCWKHVQTRVNSGFPQAELLVECCYFVVTS